MAIAYSCLINHVVLLHQLPLLRRPIAAFSSQAECCRPYSEERLADLDDWREEKEEGEESRLHSLGDICAKIDNAQASPVMTPTKQNVDFIVYSRTF